MRASGKRPVPSLILLALLLLAAMPVAAAGVTVADAATGQPLANAVVALYPRAGHSSAPPPVRASIVQRRATFMPHVLVVPPGSRVSFPNRDTTRHQVYSFSPPLTFSLNLYLRETPPPVTFDRAGVEVLGCNIHDHMQAFIVISEAPFSAVTAADGRVALEVPAGPYRLRIWHPLLEDTHQQWWEGQLDADEQRRVALTLRASPPPRDEPSELARHFQQALQQGTAP
ncbi:hypothetical protein C7446_0491 [Kushneria sinocarnis]|uniref:Plastocyanin n=1 Tax=Kushneria sinocarnis TaxID=595502 RepID=A0A420X1Y7_9GAMM|nr:Cupredoxin [Kushneria sinocarnis]RKR07675.1 hypothetical protein C7446_0491 [Kushneria sinocarnis]